MLWPIVKGGSIIWRVFVSTLQPWWLLICFSSFMLPCAGMLWGIYFRYSIPFFGQLLRVDFLMWNKYELVWFNGGRSGCLMAYAYVATDLIVGKHQVLTFLVIYSCSRISSFFFLQASFTSRRISPLYPVLLLYMSILLYTSLFHILSFG
jgi:hypothetical protein